MYCLNRWLLANLVLTTLLGLLIGGEAACQIGDQYNGATSKDREELASRIRGAAVALKCDPKLATGEEFCNGCRCTMYNAIADYLEELGRPAKGVHEIMDCMWDADTALPKGLRDSIVDARCLGVSEGDFVLKSGVRLHVTQSRQVWPNVRRKLDVCLSPAAKKAMDRPGEQKELPCIRSAEDMAAMVDFKETVNAGTCAALKKGPAKDCKCFCELTGAVVSGPARTLVDSMLDYNLPKFNSSLTGCINNLMDAVATHAGFDQDAFGKLNSTECRNVVCEPKSGQAKSAVDTRQPSFIMLVVCVLAVIALFVLV